MSMRGTAVPGFDELGDIEAANVVRCARVLLRRPLLHPGGPDGDLLPMLYRQREVLQEVFDTLLGYRLSVQRRFARLYKAGSGADTTRGVSLSPRGYAYFALTLATLTGLGRQVLLSRLVGDIRAAAVESGIEVTDDPADRRALTAALRHLVSLGVLSETEGTVSTLAGDPTAEALITIDTDLLGQLVAGPLATATDADDLITRANIARRTDTGEPSTELAVRRRLVEDPVVHYSDLPAEQAAWLRSNHAGEAGVLERYFGLVSETRREGMVVTDPADYLTDVVFPGPGTVARIALLALPSLLERGRPRQDGKHAVTWHDLKEVCGDLVESHPAAWSRRATEDPDEPVRSVTALLHRLGVLSRHDFPEGPRWLVSPAAHRWVPHPDATPAPARESGPPSPQPPGLTLFDELEG
ncbi:TIGR02678 family protein [Haloactinomyces albus]|uniref:Uncharacterized protein (TIGR02678 family) n=1 Tax=Haloactinomyces albus TaxID=1352928 RepID=A0AAE4CKK3_9ACTN|nr:TIGR02678 family protein [Haloactinomyces albus]MDR7300834.1 uncharacterized protein (TIGR02678 family) [Haloactinomyces albus]